MTTRKKLAITTKRKANDLHVTSLFTPGGTLVQERYDLGKYKPDVSLVGRELDVPVDVVAVWSENRRDENGPYKALFCLSNR